MVERVYTASPMDFEGEALTETGLQPALDAVFARWGGKKHGPANVSPAMTLGGGQALLLTEAGRVLFMRDEEARIKMQASKEVAEHEPDGRARAYRAEVVLSRQIAPNKFSEQARTTVEGHGLMAVFFHAVMFVQDTLGDVPAVMSQDEVQKRLATVRTALVRAKAASNDGTAVNFPNSSAAPFFELTSRPGEFYVVTVYVYVEEPSAPVSIRRE